MTPNTRAFVEAVQLNRGSHGAEAAEGAEAKPEPKIFLTEAEVGTYLGLDGDEMRILRRSGDGPPCSDLEGYIRYPRKGLEAWLQERGEISRLIQRLAGEMSIPELAANLICHETRDEALDRMVTFLYKEIREVSHG
jgi:hypothetical protein